MYNHQNGVSDFLHLPQEAFLFRPHHSPPPSTRDDFKIGEGKHIRRLLFDGWAQDTYTPYEEEQLIRLENHLKSKGIKLDPRWNKSWRLRYMLSTGCDLEKCLTDMERFMGYIGSVRELHPSRETTKLLSEGLFYIMGRDSHYRPILVFDAERIVKAKPTEDQLLEMQVYFLEYVIHHYFIPGQVENWVALLDSGYQGLFQLVDTMKKSFTFLSDMYRSRLFACYNVRITTSISIIWGIVKRFLQEDTIDKINLFDENKPEPLFQYAHPSQIEKKFGGTMPNIPEGSFWPPREWSTTYKFQKSPVEYMTRQEYTQLYNDGTLRETKIHQEVLIAPRSTELRENHQMQTLKKLEREFKTRMEGKEEDRLIFEKDIEPYAKLPLPVSFTGLLAKSSQQNGPKA